VSLSLWGFSGEGVELFGRREAFVTRTAEGILWQDGDEPPDRYTLDVALAFLRAFARIATLGS
jgi:hypothetical protein